MLITAKLNYLRIAPRKVRLVADLVRGKSVDQARATLKFTVKRGADPLLKLLNQAVANAKDNLSISGQINESNLYISKITVDEGPKLKRWRPRSRGQSYEIQKKTSHITIVLDGAAVKSKKIKSKSLVSKEGGEKKLTKEEKEIIAPDLKKKEKLKLRPETEIVRPKTDRKGIKKVFKRKAF